MSPTHRIFGSFSLFLAAVILGGCSSLPPGDRTSAADTAAAQEDFATTRLSAEEAGERWRRNPTDQLAAIWHARHLGYAGEHDEAIRVLTRALDHHPQSPRLLRHRGHRYISNRRYADAISDLSLASRRIAGTADEIEPDGRPNPAGIPRSTLHTNIYYHLGVASYLQGSFAAAGEAFARCHTAALNDDMRVASTYWLALCLIQSERTDEARQLAEVFSAPGMEIMENAGYHQLLGLLAGRLSYEEITAGIDSEDWTGAVTTLYGIGMWHVMHGRIDEAITVFRAVTSGPLSSAFGRLASEVEAGRVAQPLE